MNMLSTYALFILSGLLEIGGGYLVWLWVREGKPAWFGALGFVMLAVYGLVATWQTMSFGKTYVVYGFVFIVMSIWWAWYFDGFKPDRFDVIGGFVALLGIAIILFWPRP